MTNQRHKTTLKIHLSPSKRIPFSAPILLWLLLILGFSSHVATAQQPQVNVKALGSIVMNVGDMDKSVNFYSKVLSFEKVSDVQIEGPEYGKLFGVDGLRVRIVVMRLGEQNIELIQYIAPKDGDPILVDSRSNDIWFQHFAIVVSDMDKAYEQLRKHNVRLISTSPQTLPETNKAAAGIRAVKFLDPDGHPLELLWFPLDKGDPRWHSSSEKVFLGVDHTAIGIGDTEASLKFYKDLLGLRVAGGSINKGMEQDNLDNVNGAMVRITSLRPQTTFPGIEFL
ncbi:MAG: VOC family protein [Thermodesulfobacteriota bacterium]